MRSVWPILLMVAFSGAHAHGEDVIASGLRFPIDHYPDGRPKVQLTAEKAAVPPAGDISIQGAVVEFYAADGSVEGRISAENCVLRRNSKTASSDSQVTMQRPGITITGRGFEWNGNDMTIEIKDKAKVVLKKQIADRSGIGGMVLPSVGGRKEER